MADLQHGCPSHGRARQQARSDESLADLLEEDRFLGIGKQQLRAWLHGGVSCPVPWLLAQSSARTGFVPTCGAPQKGGKCR